ncbi:MAG: hypothetical protein RR949_07620, partial [Oscillospiraceae bacterium]
MTSKSACPTNTAQTAGTTLTAANQCADGGRLVISVQYLNDASCAALTTGATTTSAATISSIATLPTCRFGGLVKCAAVQRAIFARILSVLSVLSSAAVTAIAAATTVSPAEIEGNG